MSSAAPMTEDPEVITEEILEEATDLNDFPEFKELKEENGFLKESMGRLENKVDKLYEMIDSYEKNYQEMKKILEGSIVIDRDELIDRVAGRMVNQVARFTARTTKVARD